MESVNLDLLKQKLKEGLVSVTFYKTDGTLRDMACTKNVNLIPLEKLPKPKEGSVESTPRKEAEGVVKVFDVEKGAWRSFLESNVVLWSVDD